MTDDQREPLRVFTPDGVPTEIVKARGDIHRAGDFHLAAFCWVFDLATKRVLLQRRSLDKDVWPGRWDASAAGHVAAHEDAHAAMIRELDEELGLASSPAGAELVTRRLISVGGPLHVEEHVHPSGLIDRELHAAYLLGVDAERDRFAPGPEVTALAWIELADLAAFALGSQETISATRQGSCAPSLLALSPDDRVPYALPYLAALASRIREADA